jgi:single-strand DNA-binding protein
MASYNRVILMGNLTRDPQLRYLPNQTQVVEFGLAMNRRWRSSSGEDREEVTYVDCSAFGKQAEVINQYCQKGRPLMVEGRLKYDSWEDKQGGGKRSKLVVVVENFQLLGSRNDANGGGQAGPGGPEHRSSRPAPARGGNSAPGAGSGPQAETPPSEPPIGQDQQFKEDDIPF